MKLIILLITITINLLVISPSFAQCFEYEPKVTSLSGTLTRETFPGRPNYENIENGDEPETYWILKLDKSICLIPSDELNVQEFDVKDIQLVLDSAQYKKYTNYMNKRVVVTGTLFHSHTGHHHKRILLTTNEIR